MIWSFYCNTPCNLFNSALRAITSFSAAPLASSFNFNYSNYEVNDEILSYSFPISSFLSLNVLVN